MKVFLLPGSQCVEKLHANLPGPSVPLNVFSSWGGVNCHVKLTAVPGSMIRLTVTSFLIEPSDCVSDALTVYDALLPMRGRILHRSVFSHILAILRDFIPIRRCIFSKT